MEDIKIVQRYIKKYLRKIFIKKIVLRRCTPNDRRLFKYKKGQLKELQRKLAYWKKRSQNSL
jgi:hypothetical protein